MPSWIVVAPAASRRVVLLQEALVAQGRPPPTVVDYAVLLKDPQALRAAVAARPDAWVKLESPGEAPDLHDALVRRGWTCSAVGRAPPTALERGELAHQHLWFSGFADLLASLGDELPWWNSPADLLAMTDKLACQERFQALGIETPPLLGLVSSYDELQARLRAHGSDRIFIKARYGSSGAGVLAYRRHRDGSEIAIGPVEMVADAHGVRLFNSKQQRRYTESKSIARLVNALAEQECYAEHWIPKPPAPDATGSHYDVRIVVLAGSAQQRVARAGRGPLTNLHLGNRRGPLEAWVDGRSMALLETTAERAARVFPRSCMIGLDVILHPRRAWVLEANGFGDLLPRLRWQGRTTYEDQAAFAGPARTAPQEDAHA